MPESSIVNGQVTDAVTQTNVKVLGEAPAMAMGSIYQALAHSTGLLLENASAQQQNNAVIAQAATTQGVALLYSVDTAAAGSAVRDILGSANAPAAPEANPAAAKPAGG